MHGVWSGRQPRRDGLDDDVTGGGHAGFEADIFFFDLDDHVKYFDVFFAFLFAAERGDALDFAVERWFGQGVELDGGDLAGVELIDLDLVDVGFDLHVGEVGQGNDVDATPDLVADADLFRSLAFPHLAVHD